MSLIASMNISQQALLVNQAALSIVSNNIANVNTEGYSRQRVELSPGVNYTPLGGSVTSQAYSSSGVEISSIKRYADAYLQSYFREQNSNYNYLNQSSDIAANIEGLANELKGSGLEDAFSKFFEAAQTLSLNPQDVIARQNYMQQAQTIAIKFNDTASNLTDMRTTLVGDLNLPGSLQTSRVYGMVSQANTLMEEITKVNSDVVMMGSSETPPGSLLDKRDQLINQLSALVPVTVSDNSNGTINLSINGLEVVAGTQQVATLDITEGSSADTPAVIRLKDTDGTLISNTINSRLDSGKIGAVLDACGTDPDKLTLLGVMGSYDNLAGGFAEIINNIQTAATASGTPMAIDGATKQLIASTENIFESSDGGAITAGNIQINMDVLNDPYLVAVARVDPLDYDVNAIGNNSNMIEVIQARTTNFATLGNAPPETSLANIVGGIGLKTASIKSSLTNQNSVLTQVKNQLASVTGVNIDEELIDLSKYQTAYQASSRVFTVCNELLDVLINLGR